MSFKVATWLSTSFVDWDGNITAVFFTPGCNFRCPFCHNHEIVFFKGEGIPLESILNKLEEKKNWLDGIVITGGEPTIHSNLPEALETIKKKGWKIKLDTNGSNPSMLKSLIDNDLVDFIAMDVKSSPSKYAKASGVNVDLSLIFKSIEILLSMDNGKVEFRTTVVPTLVEAEDVKEIRKIIGPDSRYVLQSFVPGNAYSPFFRRLSPYKREEVQSWDDKAILRGFREGS
ncbi:MAG: anaerobic ribonucleoside-triphosphate reductase activating protein [Synergistetes bacterium]|nr:anaerobic ribonucleoside-triphosphate reductase activating protein [Synergistota bacterium]